MNNDQPTEPITPENLAEVQLRIQESLDRMNPLAGHPLLQKRLDIDGDEICGPEVQKDVEARPVHAEALAEAIGAADSYGANRGGDAFSKDEKPVKFVVPHNMTEADLKEVIDRLHKETKLPFEVVRGEIPKVAAEAPAVLRTHQDFVRQDQQRQESRFADQVLKALHIIKAAKRPVKLGFIEHELNASIFRALEPELNRHSNVRRKIHKNTVYYTWKD
jgi:hypothetical protein